eukprot:COSAG01_NODE_63826_length_278_cov_1.536313_1_plen_32_part_01
MNSAFLSYELSPSLTRPRSLAPEAHYHPLQAE